MFNKKTPLLVFFLLILFTLPVIHAQDSAKIAVTWQSLYDGIDYCEADAPIKSVVNDSKISILRINPEKCDFKLLSASEYKKTTRTAPEWAGKFDLNIIVNAGMYDLSKGLKNKGYMKNYKHFNNPKLKESYNSIIAFNPKDKKAKKFKIIDLSCESWNKVKKQYHCYAQGMRMIDCNGNPLGWNKKNQSCSMIIASVDDAGNAYFVFTRSPYTHNEMISFLLAMPFKIKSTIYLEGGPETSLYINLGEHKIEKTGSYISDTNPKDDNDHFWKLPNVIGIRPKK